MSGQKLTMSMFATKADLYEAKYKQEAARVVRLSEALDLMANPNNWFHTTDEPGGPFTAWDPDDKELGEPDQIAGKALEGVRNEKLCVDSRQS